MFQFNAKIKFLLLFFIVSFAFSTVTVANVIIQTATGGTNLSNDLSSPNVGGAAYTTLGSFSIGDQVAGDFAIASGNRTILFNAPAGWQFLAGSGAVAKTGANLQTATISVTATSISITYTISGTATVGNVLTVSGIQIQSTTKAVNGAVNLTRSSTAGATNNAVIAGFNSSSIVSTFSEVAGAAKTLQVLFPGQTNTPGTGKIGAITPQAVGTPFSVTVNALDFGFNVVAAAPANTIALSSNNLYAVLSPNVNLVNGTATFNVTAKAAVSTTFTATDVTNGSLTTNTSSAIVPTAGAYVKLLITMPGQTYAPGSPTGNTGAISTIVSNATITFGVRAVDEYFNIVTSAPANTINIVNTDPIGVTPVNSTLNAGLRSFTTARLRTASNIYTITANDVSDASKTSYTTAAVNVVAGAFAKLQILLPGQTAATGTVTGKTGTPFNGIYPQVGTAFNVVVNAVDAYWNPVTSTNTVSITSAANTNSSLLPANAALVGGTQTFSVTLYRAATSHTLVATNVTDGTKTANTSTTFTTLPGAFVKMQMILPGETAASGTATGKTGVPSNINAGVVISARVNAVDAYWNVVNTVTDVVAISTNDANATPVANAALAAGTGTRSITLRTITTTGSITLSNVTNGAILSTTATNLNVVSGGFAKLQILLPGETAAPGTTTGKTGTPTSRVAGTPFVVTVNAVDAAWNLINTATDLVGLTSTDINTTLPANANLVAGTVQFNTTLVTAGTRTITANNLTDGSKTNNTSPSVTVTAGAYAKILALLPNQTIAQGTATGVSGNPIIPANGTPFTLKLRAVDQFFNPVNGITNAFTVAKSSPLDLVAGTYTLVSNTDRSLTVTINTPGAQTLTFTDATTAISVIVNISSPTVNTTNTDYFRSVSNGFWLNSATWESSADNITWVPATSTPNSTANAIVIRSGHTVESATSLTVDQITVENGAELTVSAGIFTVSDLQVNGILSSGPIAGTITAGAGVVIGATGKYQHKYTVASGTIPTATWANGSTCEIVGYTSFGGTITGSGQNFSNLVWNAPNQNNSINGPAFISTFNAKNIDIISTGSGMVALGSSPGSSTITGNLTLTSGKVTLTSSTTNARTLDIQGNLILTAGTLSRTTGAATINFSGTSVQQYVNTGVTLSGAINFNVNANAIVDFGTSEIKGTSGNFTLANDATLITANVNGIMGTGNVGTIQNTGTRSFGLSNYTFNGTAAQSAGTGLPAVVKNLVVDNAQGVKLSVGNTDFTVNGALTINPAAGYLHMDKHPLKGAFTNSGLGTLRTDAMIPFDDGKTWTVGVEYTGAGFQNIIAGTYNGLLATSGIGFKMGPTAALNIAGNWSSAQGGVDFTSNNTPISFNGSAAQSLTDLGTNNGLGLAFNAVTFTGGGAKTLTTGKFSVSTTGVLTMGSNTTLNANGNLTLLSDASSSGSVAEVPATSVINGDVTVERFITGGSQNPFRTYRMLSSPVYDNGNASNRTYQFTQFIDDMVVTGLDGAANGFDNSPGNAASAWTYQPFATADNKFVEVTNINESLKVGQGAYLFYRGDRSNPTAAVTKPFPDPSNTTMTFEGVLNQQDVAVPVIYNPLVEGYNYIGNPYASSINWNSAGLDKTVLSNNIIRSWNPTNRQYSTYDGLNGANGGGNIIPAGQGFFVQVANDGTFTFSESAKVSAQPSFLIMSSPLQDNLQPSTRGLGKIAAAKTLTMAASPSVLRLVLAKNQTPYNVEGVVVFDGNKSANYVKNEDVDYLKGNEVYLSSLSEDLKPLTINYMPAIANGSLVKFDISDDKVTSGDYTLSVSYNDVPTDYLVKLNDKYLGTSTVMTNGSTYPFSINQANATSYGMDRFSVLFEKPTVLAVVLKSFKATKENNGVQVNWATSEEVNSNHFKVQRATDDLVYETIYEVKAKGQASNYSYFDKNPLLGNNYYRLIDVDNNSAETVSKPIVVNYSAANATLSVNLFPNPAKANVTVKYNGTLLNSKAVVKITNMNGQLVLSKVISKADLANGYQLNTANYTQGVYTVEVLDGPKERIGQVKLIKN